MSMLTEKRNELVVKLNALEVARQAEIDMKVAEYRKTIEAQTSTEQIDKVKNVIIALDEVIKYESAEASVPVQATNVAEPVQESVVNAQPQTVEARPGMATVFTPSRS